ncbi:ribosome silencing factor [Slackia piriformis]|uniref:ribosome silencing factor n=1 Tax=Slackia piriformis TaxID=626934 RepID=UPI0032C05E48
MAQDKGLSSLDKVMIAARAADSKKATDILIQDVRELVGITDFFVIVTAQNNRQISAVLDAIEEVEIKEAGVKPFSVEGAQEGFWALQDYGDFVVHVFQPEGRDYYRLEEIWNDAPTIPFVSENETASEEE